LTANNQLSALIALGEYRRDAGLKPRDRHLGYAPPPGDGDSDNPRNWLTEDEITRMHEISMSMPSMMQEREEARARIAVKIQTRKLKQ